MFLVIALLTGPTLVVGYVASIFVVQWYRHRRDRRRLTTHERSEAGRVERQEQRDELRLIIRQHRATMKHLDKRISDLCTDLDNHLRHTSTYKHMTKACSNVEARITSDLRRVYDERQRVLDQIATLEDRIKQLSTPADVEHAERVAHEAELRARDVRYWTAHVEGDDPFMAQVGREMLEYVQQVTDEGGPLTESPKTHLAHPRELRDTWCGLRLNSNTSRPPSITRTLDHVTCRTCLRLLDQAYATVVKERKGASVV